MADTDLDTKLARDESRIGPNIYGKSLNDSPWNRLLHPNRKAWPDGMSDSIRVLTVNRILPENDDEWSDLDTNLGTGNNCNPDSTELVGSYDTRSFNLTQKAVHSEPLCVNDGRNAVQTNTQIRMMYENLRKAVNYIWRRRYMTEYVRLCEHKCVCAAEAPESESHFPGTPPTSILTGKYLLRLYYRLIADSAAIDGGAFAMTNGKPVLVLITDMLSSDALFSEDKTFNAMLWNSDRVPELLRPLGVDRELRGFFHTIENLPRHFTFTGGQYVEVPPYSMAAATKGQKPKLSTAYLQAPITESYIYVPSVMNILVPNAISTQGSGTEYDPQTYMGDFKWLNYRTHDDNPFGAWGKYHALMQTGTEPVHPEFGFAIRHLRCFDDLGLTACTVGVDLTSSEHANISDSSDVEFGV